MLALTVPVSTQGNEQRIVWGQCLPMIVLSPPGNGQFTTSSTNCNNSRYCWAPFKIWLGGKSLSIIVTITKNRFFNSMSNSTVSQPTSFIIGHPQRRVSSFFNQPNSINNFSIVQLFPTLPHCVLVNWSPFLLLNPWQLAGWFVAPPVWQAALATAFAPLRQLWQAAVVFGCCATPLRTIGYTDNYLVVGRVDRGYTSSYFFGRGRQSTAATCSGVVLDFNHFFVHEESSDHWVLRVWGSDHWDHWVLRPWRTAQLKQFFCPDDQIQQHSRIAKS